MHVIAQTNSNSTKTKQKVAVGKEESMPVTNVCPGNGLLLSSPVTQQHVMGRRQGRQASVTKHSASVTFCRHAARFKWKTGR